MSCLMKTLVNTMGGFVLDELIHSKGGIKMPDSVSLRTISCCKGGIYITDLMVIIHMVGGTSQFVSLKKNGD